MQINETVTLVTTPLALAALCLLLGSGLLRAVAKAKPNAALRSAIRFGFILAAVLGVLANISFVVITSFGREIRIAGTVRDETGRPLSRAVVDIPGRGRGITDDYGAFEFSIPDSRQADTYTVIVGLDGYATRELTITGPRPKDTLNVALTQPKLASADVIQMPTKLGISHYLGMPQVDVWLKLQNPLPRLLPVRNIAIAVVSPKGERRRIDMQGTYNPGNGLYMPGAMDLANISRGETWHVGYSFFTYDNGADILIFKAQKEYPNTSSMPQPGTLVFSKELSQEFAEFASQKMYWSAGEWKLVVSLNVDGAHYERVFTFDLTEAAIQRMRHVEKYYATGAGVFLMNRLPQFPDASATTMVSLKE